MEICDTYIHNSLYIGSANGFTCSIHIISICPQESETTNRPQIMRRHFLLLLFLLSSRALLAQDLRISGEVSSALTQEGVAKAVVRLMTADGERLLATDTTRYKVVTEKGENWESTFLDKHSGAVFSLIAPTAESYKIVIEAKGFETYSCAVMAGDGRRTVALPPVYLIPRAKEQRLGEVEVKATRIKMFYKGDTLIYNADAFNVEQSESLRKLVEQLPGAELKDGEIKVNGKRIDNLLLSGKDFFNGNMQAMLDNLPAYIVSRIKVYDKDGELTELTGKDMHDQSYVMDVRLKRQYIGTWMAKLSADGGTEDMWGGQAYLMRFDERQMFSVNADMNNFNENRQMSDMGDTSDFSPWGQTTSKSARLSYYIEPNSTWRFTANGSVQRQDSEKDSYANAETFLKPSSLMTRSGEQHDGDELKVNASASLRMRKTGRWQHSLGYDFDFTRSRSTRDSRSLSYYLPAKEEWDGIPLDSIISREEALAKGNALLNSLLDPQLSRSRSFFHRPVWKSSFVSGTDLLNFNATLSHNVQRHHDFSNYRLTTYTDGFTDARRRYNFRRDYALSVSPELEWVHKYERIGKFDGVVTPFILYSYDYGSANHPEYRLERMAEWSEQQGWGMESLGRLPEEEWQSICIDESNSYFSTQKAHRVEAGLKLSHKVHFDKGSTLHIEANEAVSYRKSSLDYQRDNRSYTPRREGLFASPSLSLKWNRDSQEGRKWMPEWEANYQGRQSMPDLMLLLPIRDTSDPLNRFVGNESLENQFAHRVGAAYRLRHVKSGRSLNLSAVYRRLHNDIVMQSSYDAQTAVRTYQPTNTNRTHGVEGRGEFSTAIDSKKLFYLSASLSADYYQCENRSFLGSVSDANPGLLRNVGITPWLTLRGTIGQNLRIYARWNTAFRNASQAGTADRYRETTLYGDLQYYFPWGIQFATIVRTTLYAGNSENSLNKTVTNWDATLTKYFLQDRLGLHFIAHDLLAQASTYRSEVTMTGRTESFTDVLPRYFLLRITYSFSWIGKKNK